MRSKFMGMICPIPDLGIETWGTSSFYWMSAGEGMGGR